MPFDFVVRGALLDGRPSAVRVSRGVITEIASDLRPRGDERVIELGGLALLPGLINAHDHLSLDLLPPVGTPPYPNSLRLARRPGAQLSRRSRPAPAGRGERSGALGRATGTCSAASPPSRSTAPCRSVFSPRGRCRSGCACRWPGQNRSGAGCSGGAECVASSSRWTPRRGQARMRETAAQTWWRVATPWTG